MWSIQKNIKSRAASQKHNNIRNTCKLDITNIVSFQSCTEKWRPL